MKRLFFSLLLTRNKLNPPFKVIKTALKCYLQGVKGVFVINKGTEKDRHIIPLYIIRCN